VMPDHSPPPAIRLGAESPPEADPAHVAVAPERTDPVTLAVLNAYLNSVAREMGQAVSRTAYSTIFNEAFDFSCAVFDEAGDIVAQAEFCPAQLGASQLALRSVIATYGLEGFAEDDVFVHNDPFSGMNHLPEHMVTKAVFWRGRRVGFVCCIGHMTEVGGLAPGGFPGDAREVFHEGLRIPPVRLVHKGTWDDELWRLILANGRTPRVSGGDIKAMVGSLAVGERRVLEAVERYGPETYLEILTDLQDYSEARMRHSIRALPDGRYETSELLIDNDGQTDEPARIAVEIAIQGDELTADFSGSDPQRPGSCNLTRVATVAAVYNAILHVTDRDIPATAGRYRPLRVKTVPGTVVDAEYPASTVGGNSEVHPRIVTLIWKAIADIVPERIGAGAAETNMCISYGGHNQHGEYFAALTMDAMGWGAKQWADGYDAVGVINGNCALTPIEVLETRYPFVHTAYRLNEASCGAGRHRGGLGTVREFVLTRPIRVSSYFSGEKLRAWGLFDGEPGSLSAFLVRTPDDVDFRTFKEGFGVVCASKFSNIDLPAGTHLRMITGGGGGLGPARERPILDIAIDLFEGYYDAAEIRERYPEQAEPALRLCEEMEKRAVGWTSPSLRGLAEEASRAVGRG
jgi:N-methylhydantoinase B